MRRTADGCAKICRHSHETCPQRRPLQEIQSEKKRLDRFHRKHLICVRWNICMAPYAFDDRFPLLTRKIFPEARARLVSKILHNAKVTQKVTSPTWNLKPKTRENVKNAASTFSEPTLLLANIVAIENQKIATSWLAAQRVFTSTCLDYAQSSGFFLNFSWAPETYTTKQEALKWNFDCSSPDLEDPLLLPSNKKN